MFELLYPYQLLNHSEIMINFRKPWSFLMSECQSVYRIENWRMRFLLNCSIELLLTQIRYLSVFCLKISKVFHVNLWSSSKHNSALANTENFNCWNHGMWKITWLLNAYGSTRWCLPHKKKSKQSLPQAKKGKVLTTIVHSI